MTHGPLVLIANPAAGRGRGARALDAAHRALAAVGTVDVHITKTSGDEIGLAGDAVAAGATTIAALGGDGTWGNVAHGMMTAGGDARLVLLAAGTGNDFALSIGAPAGDYPAMARLLATGHERRVDVGTVDGRHFLNCLGFGFDAAVVDRARRMQRLRGPIVYGATALGMLLGFRGIDVAEGDGEFARALMFLFANGRRFGGAFMIAPDARVDDGAFDVVVASHVPPWRRLPLFLRAYRGTHAGTPGLRMTTGDRFRLRFREPPVYQVDGECGQAERAEVEVRCLHRALRVVAPPVSG